MQRIFFRADAGSGVGYGHFIRTLALADMLKDDFDCVFFTTTPTPYQIEQMDQVCRFISLHENNKFGDFLDSLDGTEIVVLDNYYYTTDYQIKIRDKGCKLVCIDDIHDKHFVADLIINQAINVTPDDYSCEPYTKFAFGLGYSLLRKPFFEACQKKTVNQNENCNKHNLNVVVAFGGSDFLDLTNNVILNIKDMDVVSSITAIVGDSYASEKMIVNPKVCYKKNLSAQGIADLFTFNDVAILPCSTMTNEALACGIKIIGGYYVQNQENDYFAFMLANMIMGVGDYSDGDVMKKIRQALLRLSGKDGNEISSETPRRFVELFKSLYE